MKKIYVVIIIVVCVLLAIVGIFLYERAHAPLYMDENGSSVSIIGGADGSTSIFLAGKIGGNNDIDEEVVQEIETMKIEI